MMKTNNELGQERVVNRRLDSEDVYIGRGSKWGNPFVVGIDGGRGECAELYKEWIVRGEGRHLLKDLEELEGKALGCYCAPKGGLTSKNSHRKCHGVVLAKLLDHKRMKETQRSLF